ncbi:MAG: hypothetical protein IT548_14530 [Alphaproteobacteria bacterium]|nr:hypothetical protein [Alphaproteobacteria bacterium]
MRSPRLAALLLASAVLAPSALADDTAGLQILIDMQDPSQVSKTFCVHDSKLFSVDAQTCISGSVKLTCTQVDPNDASKGVKWVVTDEKARCRP